MSTRRVLTFGCQCAHVLPNMNPEQDAALVQPRIGRGVCTLCSPLLNYSTINVFAYVQSRSKRHAGYFNRSSKQTCSISNRSDRTAATTVTYHSNKLYTRLKQLERVGRVIVHLDFYPFSSRFSFPFAFFRRDTRSLYGRSSVDEIFKHHLRSNLSLNFKPLVEKFKCKHEVHGVARVKRFVSLMFYNYTRFCVCMRSLVSRVLSSTLFNRGEREKDLNRIEFVF